MPIKEGRGIGESTQGMWMSESQIIENFDFEDQMMNGENIYLEKKRHSNPIEYQLDEWGLFLFPFWLGRSEGGG